MPPRDWRMVVDDFTRVQQLVHLANRLQPESAIDIQGKLYQQKRVAYEDTLTAQAAAVGCAGKKGVTDMATLANMMGEAGDEAEGTINTYNYDMALAIRNIATTTPTANRHVYAKRLKEWEAIRNEWKSKQIMLWNTMKWQDKAIADFLEHNPQLRQGTAEVQPQETAVCDICRTWVERGKVPIARTKEVDWPAHLNCPHHWVIKYGVESVDCSKLWVGTDFDAWLALVGQKGGAGSGNWGHTGRPGLVGGSGGSGGASYVTAESLSDDELDKYNMDIRSTWEKGIHRNTALNALDNLYSRTRRRNDYDGSILLDAGKPVAVVSFQRDGIDTKIQNVGTMPGKGYGRRIVEDIIGSTEGDVIAEATVGSRTFYAKMGFSLKPGTANIFVHPGAGARQTQ